MRLGGVECPALLWIEDGHVGVAATRKRSAAREVEDSCGTGSKEFDDTRQRDLVFTVELCDRQGQSGFQAGDAETGSFEFDLLFVGGVRGVISGDGVHGAISEGD